MPELGEDQWELGGVTFGHGCDIEVMDFGMGASGSEVGDATLPSEDGSVFGRDTVGGLTLTWDLLVNKTSGATAQATWRTLGSVWDAASTRRTPGAVLPLSLRRPGGSTSVVYGRPRKMEPSNMRLTREGVVELVADFATADQKFYSGTEQVQTLLLLPPSSVAAQTLNDNPDFETDVAGWAATGCAPVWSTAQAHAGAASGQLTPDGVTAAVSVSSGQVDADAGVRYHAGVWVRAASGPVDVRVDIAWFDSDGVLLGTSQGNAAAATSSGWVKATRTAIAPAGAASAAIVPTYADATPAAGDVVYIDDVRLIELSGFTFPLTFALQLTGTSKRASGVLNSGDLETWPVITFNGPVTNPSVAYVGTALKLSVNTTLAVGQSLTIDTRPWVRTVTRTGGGSLAGRLSGNRMAEMALPPGTTIVAFRGQDNTGIATCSIRWRDASSTP